MVYAIPSATTSLADLEGDVMCEVTALASDGVMPGELQRIKKVSKRKHHVEFLQPHGWMAQLGMYS